MSKKEIVTIPDTAVSNESAKARKIHINIVTANAIAGAALVEMCMNLKIMRDEKLDQSLGFDDFETYCEEMARIGQTQAYAYIRTYERHGAKFLEDHAKFGITKLEMLTKIPADEREGFIEANADVADISVAELKRRIEELETENGRRGEQISLLETENKELKNKPTDVAVSAPDEKEIAEIKNTAAKEAKKEAKAEFEKKLSDLENKLTAEKSAADARAAELEEKLKTATGSKADEQLVEFRFYFEETQAGVKKLLAVLDKIEDAEKQDKFRKAAIKFLTALIADLER
jgi:hypothetical protein